MRTYYSPRSTLCDPPDFSRVLARKGNIKDAWRNYASTATRPYSYETFRWRYRQWFSARKTAGECMATEMTGPIEATANEFVASERYWRSRSNPKARVLALRTGASVRVRNGALEIAETLPQHLSADCEPIVVTFSGTETRRGHRLSSRLTPKAIVLPEHGWYLTAEGVKFCLEHKIDLISVSARSSQGEKGLMTVVAGDAQNNGALVRAQVLADPADVAREIVRNKIGACATLGRVSAAQARGHDQGLDRARTVDAVRAVEAHAASSYWATRQCRVRSSSRRWPRDWERFTVRKSWIGGDDPRHADHPVNALLNWSYAVVAGRLAAQLLARGAYLGIGYLHADKLGRYSLVYDAIEVLRPLIDEKVFAFVDGAIFRIGDFQVTPSGPHRGEVRVSPELLNVFGPATCLPAQVVEEAAEWLVETILNHFGMQASPAEVQTRPIREGN